MEELLGYVLVGHDVFIASQLQDLEAPNYQREAWLEEKAGAAREHFRGPDGFLTPV